MSMHAHNGLLAACCKGLDGRLDEGCCNRASVARRAAC